MFKIVLGSLELLPGAVLPGSTTPLCFYFGEYTSITYWYNYKRQDDEPWFSVHRFKWHFSFHFGPVTIAF